MEDSIFFKDTTDVLKGPFTERQVQEWYRKRWFESSFRFYFTQNDEHPSNFENNGITLDSLRSRNGFGCPFIKFDVNEKSEYEKHGINGEEKLARIEKEIADLQQKCSVVLSLEQNIERMEQQAEILTTSYQKGASLKAEAPKIEVEPVKISEQAIEEIGNAVASYVLDAFAVYASGNFGSWKKERTEKILSALAEVKTEDHRKICERILVERMNEKDFFCCHRCQKAQFKHKQALVHFLSADHINKETAIYAETGVTQVRRVLETFAELINELTEMDKKVEAARFKKHGEIDLRLVSILRPAGAFVMQWCEKYAPLIHTEAAVLNDPLTGKPRYMHSLSTMLAITEGAVTKAKGSLGRKAFAELHKHLGTGLTCCVACEINTGDREGFYAHVTSAVHMLAWDKLPVRFDMTTFIINVCRKDLV